LSNSKVARVCRHRSETWSEPKFLSIIDVARFTAESQWTVKAKLRAGIYRAKKSGRRTLVVFDTVKRHMAELPDVKFAAPPRKNSKRGRS
jgi:hypothetical protein